MTFQVDTGASVNVIPKKYVGKTLTYSHAKTLKAWNDTVITPCGSGRIILRHPKSGKGFNVEFTVVNEDLTPLIGLRAAEQMNLICVTEERNEPVSAVSPIDVGRYLVGIQY